MQQDGKVRLLQASSKATEKTISFFNAYCTGLDISFLPGQGGASSSRAGSTGMPSSQVQLQISPQRIAIGAVVHDNNWPLESHGAGESFVSQTPTDSKPEKKEEEPSAFMEGLHTVLDVVGMIPVLGEVADAANAAIYVAEGRYGEAALSAASMIPLAGNAVGAAKLARRGMKLIAKAREFKQVKKLWKSGADLMEKSTAWAGKAQSGSTGFLGSPRLSRRELQAFKKQAKAVGAEPEVLKDKAVLRMMDIANAQAGFQASINKLFVRKGATAYEVTHELIHARHCAEIGKDVYE